MICGILISALHGNLLGKKGMHGGLGATLGIWVVNFARAFINTRCRGLRRGQGSLKGLQSLENSLSHRGKKGGYGIQADCMSVQSGFVWFLGDFLC